MARPVPAVAAGFTLVAVLCDQRREPPHWFSADSRYFLLVDSIAGFPLLPGATMFIIVVATNACFADGCKSLQGAWESEDDEYLVPGRLRESMSRLRERLGLVPPRDAKRFTPRAAAGELVAYGSGDSSGTRHGNGLRRIASRSMALPSRRAAHFLARSVRYLAVRPALASVQVRPSLLDIKTPPAVPAMMSLPLMARA